MVTDSNEGLSSAPSNTVMSTISNPLPNINTITSLYPPPAIVSQPPPGYTAPPPPLPINSTGHDGNATGIYSIPPHYSGSTNQYNSFGQYGPTYQ